MNVATLIQRHDEKSFHFSSNISSWIQFKNERFTEILQAVRCHILWIYINLLNQSWIVKRLLLWNMEPLICVNSTDMVP